jgi:hypothetical protein
VRWWHGLESSWAGQRIQASVLVVLVAIFAPLLAVASYLTASKVFRIPDAMTVVCQVLLLGAFAVADVFGWIFKRGHARRVWPGHCANCGYDLRGSRFRCPECGDAWMMHEKR